MSVLITSPPVCICLKNSANQNVGKLQLTVAGRDDYIFDVEISNWKMYKYNNNIIYLNKKAQLFTINYHDYDHGYTPVQTRSRKSEIKTSR